MKKKAESNNKINFLSNKIAVKIQVIFFILFRRLIMIKGNNFDLKRVTYQKFEF